MSKKRKGRVTAKLRLYPDPILTQVCEPVKDGEDVSGIIRDMMHILVNSKTGVGLAAPQAGHLKRIIIIKNMLKGTYGTLVNPVITEFSGKTTDTEGCLSYPGKEKIITRHYCVLVNYESEEEGKVEGGIVSGLNARIIQHEIDHLDGKCKVGEK